MKKYFKFVLALIFAVVLLFNAASCNIDAFLSELGNNLAPTKQSENGDKTKDDETDKDKDKSGNEDNGNGNSGGNSDENQGDGGNGGNGGEDPDNGGDNGGNGGGGTEDTPDLGEIDDTLTIPTTYSDNYGYKYLKTYDAGMVTLYENLYSLAKEFSESDRTVSSSDDYKVGDVSVPNLTAKQVSATFYIFGLDNPEFYWISNSYRTTASGSYVGKLTLLSSEDYDTAAKRKECDTAINTLSKTVEYYIEEGESDLEKAFFIHNYIVNRMDYAYKADGVTPEDARWAHNIVGCAQKKKGVCESYAKTYSYILKKQGIDCVIATGQGSHVENGVLKSEAHAWNLIFLDDKWYGVDCTWDEMSDSSAVAGANFGLSSSDLAAHHTAYTSDINAEEFLYKLPALAGTSLQVVELEEDGVSLGLYGDMDAAFSAMTDTAADYSVTIGLAEHKNIDLYNVDYNIYSTASLPEVKSVTLNGVYVGDSSSFRPVSLYLPENLTAVSDITVKNLIIAQGKLTAKNLTVSGNYFYLYGEIKADKVVLGTTTRVRGNTAKLEADVLENKDANRNLNADDGATITVTQVNNALAPILLIMNFETETDFPKITIGTAAGKIILTLNGTIEVDGEKVAATKDNFTGAIAVWTESDYITHCSVGCLSGGTIKEYSKTEFKRNALNKIVFIN